jgi:hypothetical protein
MMGVEGYAEIFLSILGWHFYGVLWDVMSASGVVFLPFLGILFDTWKNAYVDEFGAGAGPAIRTMEVEIYLALTVVMLAGTPTGLTNVNRLTMAYTPVATALNPTPVTATGGASDSTFGAVFASSPARADVPVWWYSVMALSSGLNRASIAGSSVGVSDLRQFEQQARLVAMENPQLRAESQRFYWECFHPTRTQFLNNPKSAAAAAAISAWGLDDTDWMGSHAFRDDPELYAVRYAEREVVGFAFDPSRDRDLAGGTIVPTWGRPSCKEWWEAPTTGLREKLVAESKNTGGFWDQMSTLFAGLSLEKRSDTAAKVLLSKTPSARYDPEGKGLIESLKNPATLVRDGLGQAGLLWEGAKTQIMLSVLKPALPLIQAVVLMCIYMLIGLLLIVSRYSVNTMILGGLAIFTVKFWSVLWFVTGWLDENLMKSMHPVSSELLEALTTLDNTSTRIVTSLLVAALYIGLPVLWSLMLGWVGINLGHALNTAKGALATPLQAAGAAGARAGMLVLTRGGGRIAGGVASAGGRLIKR